MRHMYKLTKYGLNGGYINNFSTFEKRMSRLVYQSRKRGILENCLMLGQFAERNLKEMSNDDIVEYERLLEENDWDIYYWIVGERKVPNEFERVIGKIRTSVEEGKNKMKETHG
ncbi:DUF339-domain-containing protein [Rozella allomycis CSF55]|uniref:DUF339-domain-containing protein n=1 Tax=Rozella allomycis (strain CSF55) TaxID=988480 RepID=A0A4P9YI07_ROZAC|nr:DUF339-domain-containing protein [Rozella allomycis CSF55]